MTIVIMMAGAIAAAAQKRLLELHGNRITEVPDPDSTGVGLMWDFTTSGSEGVVTATYMESGDSLVMEFLPTVRSDFAVKGDTPILTVAEGNRWRFKTDSLRPLNAERDSIAGILGIDLSRRMSVEGVLSKTITGGHRAIVQQGDTICGISLLVIGITGSAAISDSLCRQFASISRYWLTEGGRYPIAIERGVTSGDEIREYCAAVFPPDQQPEGENDIAADRLFSAVRSAGSIRSPLPGEIKNISGRQRSDGLASDVADRAGQAVITASGKTIHVAIAADGGAADVLLCDVAGRVIESHPGVTDGISIDGLPPGEYLVSVSGESWRVTEKKILR